MGNYQQKVNSVKFYLSEKTIRTANDVHFNANDVLIFACLLGKIGTENFLEIDYPQVKKVTTSLTKISYPDFWQNFFDFNICDGSIYSYGNIHRTLLKIDNLECLLQVFMVIC